LLPAIVHASAAAQRKFLKPPCVAAMMIDVAQSTLIMLQLSIISHDDVLRAQIGGLVSLEAWEKVLRELEEVISSKPNDRLVLNLSQLVGWLGVPERTQVGALMAKHLHKIKKAALYIQPHKITGVVQAEAQRNGLDLRLFGEYDAALDWALS
jgi:hypothetical protein